MLVLSPMSVMGVVARAASGVSIEGALAGLITDIEAVEDGEDWITVVSGV